MHFDRYRGLAKACLLAVVVSACVAKSGQPEISLLSTLPQLVVEDLPAPSHGRNTQGGVVFDRAMPRLLPSGELLVVDGGSSELRFFRDGNLLRRMGGRGDGPGESSGWTSLALARDTIMLFGGITAGFQVSLFTGADGFVKRFRPVPPAGSAGVIAHGWLGRGRLLVEIGRGFLALTSVPSPNEMVADSIVLGILSLGPDDSPLALVPLGAYVRDWLVPHAWPDGPIPIMLSRSPVRLGMLHAVSDSVVWVIDRQSGSFQVFSADGSVRAAGTIGMKAELARPEEIQVLRRWLLDSAITATDSAAVEASLEASFLPASWPLIDHGVAGVEGEIWIRLFSVPPATTHRYVGLTSLGAPFAWFETPSSFHPHQVTNTQLLGITSGPDGHEEVTSYRFHRLH
jgi:hypothetical protein